jgi:hypothetical protein
MKRHLEKIQPLRRDLGLHENGKDRMKATLPEKGNHFRIIVNTSHPEKGLVLIAS